MESETGKAGYTTVTLYQTLAPGTSAHLAELIALTRALQVTEEQKVSIYIDSKYVFLVLHAHAAI